jgi:orotidine-5'-phosphate decarboxylase
MIDLRAELTPAQSVALAVDTSLLEEAQGNLRLAKDVGAEVVKIGLELITATSPEECSKLVAGFGLDWIGDFKLDDISNTVENAMGNIAALKHPPLAVTIHTNAGVESMRKAQIIASESGILLFAVTELTPKKEKEIRERLTPLLEILGINVDEISDEISLRKYMVLGEALQAHEAGLEGLVSSAHELTDPLSSVPALEKKLKLVPAIRFAGGETHDQQNVATPEDAVADGADILVMGRPIRKDPNPPAAFQRAINGVELGRAKREAA